MKYERGNSVELIRFFDDDVRSLCDNLIADTDPLLIHMNLKSHFMSRRTYQYQIVVLIDKNGTGRTSILQYYCNCKVGSRTVGCCSHVMSLLYYVAYAPHHGGVKEVCKHLSDVFENAYEEER